MGYKMKGFSGFKDSPLKQDYVKDRYHAKYNPDGTKGKTKIKIFPDGSTTKTTTLPGGHHHRVTTGPEAMRPPKDAIVKKAAKKGKSIDKYKDVKAAKMTKEYPKAKNLKTVTKVATKKSLGKTILKGAGKAAKFAAKRLGPVGYALTAYEVGKTIPKVAKATMKGLKKRAKSGNVNAGRKL